jgi:hypothetical protein
MSRKLNEIDRTVVVIPIDPGDLIVLAVGVIVSVLAATKLVTG